jgi:hypothetical protein
LLGRVEEVPGRKEAKQCVALGKHSPSSARDVVLIQTRTQQLQILAIIKIVLKRRKLARTDPE